MRTLQGWLLSVFILPTAVYAQEAMMKEVHDIPAVRGSIIANMLQERDDPFALCPYDTNYIAYTQTSDLDKEAVASYNWVENTRKDEVKLQLSLVFLLWRGILGPNSILDTSCIQRSWQQLSNNDESSSLREINYKPQLFLGFVTNHSFAGQTLRDVETGYNHDSSGRPNPTSRSWNRLCTRLMTGNSNQLVEVKPWYVVENVDDNPDITKYMSYYQFRIGYHLGGTVLSTREQYNWNTSYGGVELGSSYPITKHVRLYTQVYSGYGGSSIDYNFNQIRAGVGVMLDDLF